MQLSEPLAAGTVLGGGGTTGATSDAYTRLLMWEATMTMRRGQSRLMRYRRAFEYYGSENVKPDELIQPLEINYLKATCEAHASFLWGQWEPVGRLVGWAVAPRSGKGDKATMADIDQWLSGLFDSSEETLFSAGLNQSIYGDAILKPRYHPELQVIVPESVLPEYFHVRWSNHDISEMREVIISYPVDRNDALEEFGTKGNQRWSIAANGFATSFAVYWEQWTPMAHRVWIDDKCVIDEPNPFSAEGLPGIIPFVHIPNVRSGGEFFGTSDIEAVLALQDELNKKMADSGDMIAYAAHPIVLIRKYFGKVENLPVGPDSIWDMGRDGEAEYMSGGKPPIDINVYIDRLLAIYQDLSYMPAAAFGRSDTAQASALALAMEMMPVTQRVGWKRLHWKQALINYALYAARLAEQHGILPFPRRELLKYVFVPTFAPVLPKDRAATVMENISLVSGGLRTIKRALEDMGERDAATQALAVIAELEMKIKMQADSVVGGKNAPGPGGSPDTGSVARDAGK